MLRLLFFKGRSWKPPVGDWKPYLKYWFIYSILKKVEPYYPCDRRLVRGYQSWGNMVLHSLVFVKWFPVDDECCAPFSALASECNVPDTNVEVTSCRRQERTVFCKMETFPLAFLKDSYAFSDRAREEQVRSDWTQGKQRVLFPRGPQCFPWSQLLGVLLCFPNQKYVEQIAKKYLFDDRCHTNLPRFLGARPAYCTSKVPVVVTLESDMWPMTRDPLSSNRKTYLGWGV